MSWFPMRQNGALRPLRRDCGRLRNRIMSYIVLKRRTAVFYHKFKLEYMSCHTFSHNWKKQRREYHKSHEFWLWEQMERDWEVIEFCESVIWALIYDRETTFWRCFQHCMTEKIVIFVPFISSNYDSMCGQTDHPALIYDRKKGASTFWHYTTFYDLSVSRNLLSKAEWRQYCAAETEVLSYNLYD